MAQITIKSSYLFVENNIVAPIRVALPAGSFSFTGEIDYSAIYGKIDFSQKDSITDGGHNELHEGEPDELNLGDVLTMTLPDDITPDAASPLVGTGDPALGLADDIFDTSREQPDTIGAVYVSATPPPGPTEDGYVGNKNMNRLIDIATRGKTSQFYDRSPIPGKHFGS